jgi:hypothetical protein
VLDARWFAIALLIGAILRIAALPLKGTDDQFAGWAHVAATRGAPVLYQWAGTPEDANLRRVDGFYAQGDYPPVAFYALGAIDRVRHWAIGDHVTRTKILPASVKVPGLLAEAWLAVLLFVVTRRFVDMRRARQVTLIYWLNPAALLSTSVFGDLDALFMLPAIGALVAAVTGWLSLAGSLMAVALLIKPQALLVVPALVLAVWSRESRNRPLPVHSAAIAAGLTSLVLLMPIVAEGAAWNMILAVGSITLGADTLSSATNLWWIVGHLVRVMQMPAMDFLAAITTRAESVPFSAFFNFEPVIARIVVRLVGSILALAAIGWAVWTVRRERDLWMISATGAFVVHAYVVLATQVHENHLFGAVPLLALAAAGRPRFLPLAIVTGAIYAANMNLMYGLGEDDLGYFLPRTLMGIDLTLVLAAANCAALAWHAAVLQRESAEPVVGALSRVSNSVVAPRTGVGTASPGTL